MDTPRIRLLDDNVIEIYIGFRVPPNVLGGRKEVEVEGFADDARWVSRIQICRGAMHVTAIWDCGAAGFGPCRLSVRAKMGCVTTEEAVVYYGPVPGRVTGLVADAARRRVRWDAVECIVPVKTYRIYDGAGAGAGPGPGRLVCETADTWVGMPELERPWGAWSVTGWSVAAVNVNGEGARRELKELLG